MESENIYIITSEEEQELFEEEREKIFVYQKELLSENYDEHIVGIELKNNNKIYIKYNIEWTIKDLIKRVLNHKEFHKIYRNKILNYNSNFFINHFDLEMTCFQKLKDILERKIDYSITMKDLLKLKLLKNNRFPFFGLIDNRNLDYLKMNNKEEIISNNEFLYCYDNFLPRTNSYYFLIHNPDSELYFMQKKESINYLRELEINSLIWPTKKWFILSDETLSFLMNIENEEFENPLNIKYDKNNNLFSQDILPEILLSSNEYKSFLVEIFYENLNSLKFECKLSTTGKDLMDKLNNKFNLINKNYLIKEDKKLLKVKGFYDYFLDVNIPLGKMSYIDRCLKEEKNIELILIDNPFKNIDNFSDYSSRISSKSNIYKRVNSVNCKKKIQFTKDINRRYDIGLINIPKRQSIRNSLIYSYIEKIVKENNYSYNNILYSLLINIEEKLIQKLNSNNIVKGEVENKEIESKTENTFIKKVINKEKSNNIFYFSKSKDKDPIKLILDNSSNIKSENSEIRKRGKAVSTKKLDSKIITENLCEKNLDFSRKDSKENESSNLYTYKNNSICKSNKFLKNNEMDNKNIFKLLRKNNLELYFDLIQNSTLSYRMNNYYLKLQKENIDIETIDIPLKLSIKELCFLSYIGNSIESDLYLTFQLFIGKNSFSSKKGLYYFNNNINFKDNNKVFIINKNIIFQDVCYCQLPLFVSLIIKIYKVEKNTYKEISWANFKLFNHKNLLKTGTNDIILHLTPFNESSYFKWDSYYNFNQNKDNVIFIQFPSFNNSVEKIIEPLNQNQKMINLNNFFIKEKDEMIIENIKIKSPFEELNLNEREILWNNRYAAANYLELIPRIIECIDYKNKDSINEISYILENAKLINPIAAINLLSGNYIYEEVRKYAIKCISQFSYQEILDYIIQLTQALKYEQNHNSDLAKYLLKFSIKYPLTIGHSFFWCLRSEMHVPEIQLRYGLLLEAFLSKVDLNYLKLLRDEIWLLEELLKIADIPFDKKFKDKSKADDLMKSFYNSLNDLNNLIKYKEIPIPINFNIRIKQILVDDCKIMKSKKKPLWISFLTSDDRIIRIILKKGDDLRQDLLTLQIFKTIQNLWFKNGLKLKMSIYCVISTGFYQGMLEIVENSETLANIHKEYGGVKATFSDSNLYNWFEKNVKYGKKEYVKNFKLSCAAYSIATFIMGIGDRHNDNIMVKKNGEIFHIDFGHFLGHFKYKMGIKRETAPFVFTPEFKKILGENNSLDYQEFRILCNLAFKIIRKNSYIIKSLLQIMICSDIPELNDESIKFIEKSLFLKGKENEIETFLETQFQNALTSLATKLMFAFHVIAN